MSDYVDIRRALSSARLKKFGPIDGDKETWLRQMDDCAADLGLPNVYRTHPYRTKQIREAAE